MMCRDEVVKRAKDFDANALLPFLRKGQVTYFIEEDAKIRGIVSAQIVNAGCDRVWEVLTDFNNYSHHLPGMEYSKVISRSDKSVRVKFAVGVKVMGLGGSVPYTYRLELNKPIMDNYDEATGEICGMWGLYPIKGQKDKIVLMHADVAKDVKGSHMVVRFVVDKLPPAEYAFHLGPVAMLVRGIARWAEGLQ